MRQPPMWKLERKSIELVLPLLDSSALKILREVDVRLWRGMKIWWRDDVFGENAVCPVVLIILPPSIGLGRAERYSRHHFKSISPKFWTWGPRTFSSEVMRLEKWGSISPAVFKKEAFWVRCLWAYSVTPLGFKSLERKLILTIFWPGQGKIHCQCNHKIHSSF